MQRTPMVIDTDGGTDDAVALWWALTDPRVELLGVVVTWGNVELPVAAANVCRILHAAGRPDIPVALGAHGPLGPSPLPERPRHVHGDDGLGGHADRWPVGDIEPMSEPVAERLARLAAARPGEMALVTIGPLSSLAGALQADPTLAGGFASLTVMGGAVGVPGNALPLGEANIAHDPEAAAVVLAATWPDPPLLVGLDVTLRAVLADDDLALADEGRTPAAEMLAAPLRFYAGFYAGSAQTAPGTTACHDLLAALAVVEPAVLTEVATLPLAVDTGRSAAWGATVADRRARPQTQTQLPGFHPCRVAVDVDAERFRAVFRKLCGDPAT